MGGRRPAWSTENSSTQAFSDILMSYGTAMPSGNKAGAGFKGICRWGWDGVDRSSGWPGYSTSAISSWNFIMASTTRSALGAFKCGPMGKLSI